MKRYINEKDLIVFIYSFCLHDKTYCRTPAQRERERVKLAAKVEEAEPVLLLTRGNYPPHPYTDFIHRREATMIAFCIVCMLVHKNDEYGENRTFFWTMACFILGTDPQPTHPLLLYNYSIDTPVCPSSRQRR